RRVRQPQRGRAGRSRLSCRSARQSNRDPGGCMNPITFEVVKNRLLAIAEEMENSLMRSAYSPGVKEMRDCSCSLFDPSGQVVAQAAALPMHLGALTPAVEYLLKRHPPSTMAEGDLFITNEPSQGGTHLQDF